MWRNSKGFTFVEALVAFHIVLVIVFTVAPIVNIVYFEREVLFDRRTISSKLHDELQTYIYNGKQLPMKRSRTINNLTVTIQMTFENEFIQACANWKNVKEREENICFYGLPVYK